MSKPYPALNQALEYLRLHFTKEKLHPGQRLPTVREIARNAGVSPPTLGKALAIHRKVEQLSVSPRRGIVFKAGLAEPETRPVDRAEEVALRLTRDIAKGTYSKLPFLPSGKELQEIYGTGFDTMARVLDRLIARGVVSRYRRRYTVRTTRGKKAELTVLLIVSSGIFDQIEKFGLVRTRVYPLLHAMEADCIRRNIRLTMRSFAGDPDVMKGLHDVIGIAVLFEPHFPPVDQANALVQRLLQANLPIFLFDGAENEFYGELPPSKLIYSPEYTGVQQGHEIGRFLIDRGHRTICYFSHEPGLKWSDTRLRGLENAFTSAGFTNAVSAFYAANPRKVPLEKGTINDQKSGLPSTTARMRVVERHIAALQREFAASVFLDRALSQIEEAKIDATGAWSRFFPLCEKALDVKDATAWVAAEDQIAFYSLLPFLRRRRIDVPGRMSVVGFNNIPESLTANLTTYDLDVPSVGLTAIDLFLFPQRRHSYTTKGNVVKRNGFIVDRGSVRRLGARGPG
jgi:DNA-binding LacI/PurR family transcriptional regulator